MRVLVTGASGFIGTALCQSLLRSGHELLLLARAGASRTNRYPPQATVVQWDPKKGLTGEQLALCHGVEAVVHLAGEPVAARRWTAAQKARILESRVVSTRALVQGMTALPVPPRTMVTASAIGIYGNRGEETLDEKSSPGSGFLAQVCRAWEEEARQAQQAGIRSVQLRIGLVLGTGGGALQPMLLPFRLGLGGPLGSGQQWMSWIHLHDVVGLIQSLIQGDLPLDGAVNATAPHPVRNEEFTRTLGTLLKRPTFLRVPAALLRLALGEMSQLLLDSQRVIPKAALEGGYRFRFPHLTEALEAALFPQHNKKKA